MLGMNLFTLQFIKYELTQNMDFKLGNEIFAHFFQTNIDNLFEIYKF